MLTRWSDIGKTHLYNPSSILLGVLLGIVILGIAIFVIIVYTKSDKGKQKINKLLKKYNTDLDKLKSEIKSWFKK